MKSPVTLKPCPFCGQKAEFNETSRFYIGCTNPNCQGFFANIDAARYQFYNNAVESWNKRAILLNITTGGNELAVYPCPFCGSTKLQHKSTRFYLNAHEICERDVIFCSSYACRGSDISKITCHTIEEAKRIWNTRA